MITLLIITNSILNIFFSITLGLISYYFIKGNKVNKQAKENLKDTNSNNYRNADYKRKSK